MKIVLAGNFTQYLNWLAEKHISAREAIYAGGAYALHGQSFKPDDELVYIGTWFERDDLNEITAFLATRMIVEKKER